MSKLTQLPPLSLYIHIPWCVQKCPYCDFNSHSIKDQLPEEKYLQALLIDLEQELPEVWGRRVQTIFIGGGTPSTFQPETIAKLIDGVRARIGLSPHAEVTMEANPGTLDNSRLSGFFQAGVNRLSLGIQSFDDQLLKNIGRIHDGQHAIKAVESAQQAGFDNINLDFMFALPGQTKELAQRDIETAVALAPQHISYYHLTLEPNTWFYKHPPTVPEEDDVWQIQEYGQNVLAKNGFLQYETSAYAQPKRQSRHNLNYWQFGDYLGIGAGAHGKITRSDTQTIQRRWKEKHPTTYMQKILEHQSCSTTETLAEKDIVFEFLMNALRLEHGFKIEHFELRTGLEANLLVEKLAPAVDRALIDINHQHIVPTTSGKQFLNELLMLLIDD